MVLRPVHVKWMQSGHVVFSAKAEGRALALQVQGSEFKCPELKSKFSQSLCACNGRSGERRQADSVGSSASLSRFTERACLKKNKVYIKGKYPKSTPCLCKCMNGMKLINAHTHTWNKAAVTLCRSAWAGSTAKNSEIYLHTWLWIKFGHWCWFITFGYWDSMMWPMQATR